MPQIASVSRNAAHDRLRERFCSTDLWDNLPVGVCCCDTEGYLLGFNRRAIELWGRRPEVQRERYGGATRLFTEAGVLLPKEQGPLAEALRTGKSISKAFYRSLATRKQKPRLLWIGCSDSRVVPAQITSADPGELFEIRNIANVVPPAEAADDSVGAAIEYAIGHLGVDDIVVCGHTNCGGIQALMDGARAAPDDHLGRWLSFTLPAHRLVAAARVPEPERLLKAIKAHIQFQVDNLLTYKRVREGVEAGKLGVHGWLYVMETGDLLAYDSSLGEWLPLSRRAEP